MTEKEKAFLDSVNKEYFDIDWNPGKSIQEFYYDCFSDISFCHKGHEYFIYQNLESKEKPWTIFDRDLKDPEYAYNVVWGKEPRFDYADLADLAFTFKLQNDGRTIADYICDFNSIDRLLVPEPVDKKWRG